MVTVDPPILPPRLFRYRPLGSIELADQELGAILNNFLWCSRYSALNDPMEGFFGASPWLSKQTTYKKLADEILNQKHTVGICCFSDTNDNELMWTHYASNYAGICVAYSTHDLCAGLDDSVHIARVAYNNTPPRIGRADKDDPQRSARKILSHKKSSWFYEREWRLLTSQQGGRVPGPLEIAGKSPVKAVYLGVRLEDGVKQKLVYSLRIHKIKIYEMKVSNYNHSWPLLTR
ncbi:DUF2971 domain-containing protein [Hoeflea sp. WL0058]|uniref:DUF2971 domain-containing protein n=1 Tax=Flavimaribacter sediminis TaxID=2865987 RepID=A0AAE3D081_9HYPH|nr:DUF2971 domain-containing protein [Flavimaribacter sediminis]MBW8638195.1 DUF2971 domain-containing protein [Flavimaribacter sediminis]